jgi:hypothetical protein
LKKYLFRPKFSFLITVFRSITLLIVPPMGILMGIVQIPTPTQTPNLGVQQTSQQIMTMQSQTTATPHQALNPGRRDTPVPQNPESPQTNSTGGASNGVQSSLWQIIVVVLIVVIILVKGDFKV